MKKLHIAVALASSLVALPMMSAEPTSNPPQASALGPQSSDNDDKAIEAIMKGLENSFKSGNFSYQFEIMFTPLLNAAGGKKQVLGYIKDYEEGIRRQQIAFASWTASKPYLYVSGSRRKYTVIRYESTSIINGRRMRKTSYELGIKRPNSSWQFVSGDNLDSEAYDELFPDFPRGFELPKVERVFETNDAPGVRQVLAGYTVGKTKFEQFVKDASLVKKRRPEASGMTNLPPVFKSNLSGAYEPDKASGWRLYEQRRNIVHSSGKDIDELICVVGDAEGPIATLTFDHGTLSKFGPAK